MSLRKYMAEFIGTMMLVFIGTAVATLTGYFGAIPAGSDPLTHSAVPLGSAWLLVSLAFGFTLMVLAFTLGGVSGCHVNPAVTIAMFFAKRMDAKDVAPYIVCQIAGGFVASIVLLGMLVGLPGYDVATYGLGANWNPKLDPVNPPVGAILISEVVLTMFFLIVIFSATDGRNLPPGFAPIPIGMFLFVAHLIGVPLGDASLNPARSLGPALVTYLGDSGSSSHLTYVWIFFVGPIIGALLGYAVYRILWPPEPAPDEDEAPRPAGRKARRG